MPRPLPAAVLAATGGDAHAIREHILDAAHRIIDTSGLAAASTRAIADEAGLAGGTLYNYFENHQQLVAASIVRRAGHLMDPIAGLPARAGRYTVAGNLRFFVRQAATVLDQLVPALAATFSDSGLLDAVRRELARGDRLDDPAQVVEGYLAAERDLGRVSPGADCHAAAAVIVSLCHNDAFARYLNGPYAKPASRHREIDFIARSLAP